MTRSSRQTLFILAAAALVALSALIATTARQQPAHTESRASSSSPALPSAAPVHRYADARPTSGLVGPGIDDPRADRQASERERVDRRRRPLLQQLPWRGNGIALDLIDVDPHGRLVLEIATTLPRAAAIAAYSQLLHRFHDPGTSYVPRLRSAG
jgi:hypothetical protein